MNVLLSIKPKYVDEILAGKKIFEFRKAIFKKKDINKVFIYSSSPVKKVVASFEIDKIIDGSPQKIWEQCQKYGGISKEDFFNYFKNSDIGYAIEIKNLDKFSEPIDPYLLKTDFRAPQSYCYLSLDYFELGATKPIPRKKTQDAMLSQLVTSPIRHANVNKESKGKFGWKIVRLGDFAIYKKGKKPKKQQAEANEIFKYPYVDIKAFDKGEVDFYTDGEKCVICEDDDFVMVWDGSRSGYVGKAIKGALGSTLMRINFPGIENNFAYYFLQSKYLEINTRAKGTGTPHVDPGILWNYQFPVPPLPEQHAIVSKIEQLFSDLDNGISNLKLAQEQLKVYRQAVLKKAFEGELTKEWRDSHLDIDDSKSLLNKIKSQVSTQSQSKRNRNIQIEELQYDLPFKWNWATLSDISVSISDGDHQAPPKSELGVPFIVISNISSGKLELSKTKYVPEQYYENLAEKRKPQPGDILYSVTGSYGIPILISDEYFFCFQRHIALIRPHKEISSKFLYYALKSPLGYKQATKVATGTAQLTVSLSGLRIIKIPFPPIPEQQAIITEIETRLSVCDKVEQEIEENLEKAEALRQSILKRAFEGKLLNDRELEGVRSSPDWKPAEVLLERIKTEKSNKK